MNYGQVTVTTSATPIVVLADRRDVVMVTLSAAMFLGDSAVTASNGCPVPAGVYYISPGNPEYVAASGTLYGIVASGTATAGFIDMSNQENS